MHFPFFVLDALECHFAELTALSAFDGSRTANFAQGFAAVFLAQKSAVRHVFISLTLSFIAHILVKLFIISTN